MNTRQYYEDFNNLYAAGRRAMKCGASVTDAINQSLAKYHFETLGKYEIERVEKLLRKYAAMQELYPGKL